MSIEKFYTTTITNARMAWSNESSAEVSVGSFSGHVQQATPEYTEFIGEAWGKVFLIWCDEATDIEAGDTITIASGDYAGTFSVKNIQINATGNNKHFEVTIIKDI